MLMADLSHRSGVPVATIKYYLREGLLRPGAATSATRADYDEAHLRRLKLIRALLEIGEIPIAAIGRILAIIDDESAGVHQMLGAVQYALGPHPGPPAVGDPDWEAARREVDDLISGMGWIVATTAPARGLLAATLATLRRTRPTPAGPGLRAYAEALTGLASREVASLREALGPAQAPDDAEGDAGPDHAGSRIALAESAVVGMVLHERVMVAVRRLAQEDASARYFTYA